jgi:hypothetical protein
MQSRPHWFDFECLEICRHRLRNIDQQFLTEYVMTAILHLAATRMEAAWDIYSEQEKR